MSAKATVSMLPLPQEVLRHHGARLFPLMRQWLSARRMPPVLLLAGPAGIGKRRAAHFLAQWLLCPSSGFDDGQSPLLGGLLDAAPAAPDAEPGPCGKCPACARAAAGNWIDFEEISPEGAEEGKAGSIKIDQLRALKAGMGFGAHEGQFRVTLIERAETMTPQAANSLLKVLEEPPPGRIFILTANDASLLLPTLVSRCQRVTLRPFDEATLATLAERSGAPAERARAAAALAQGSWERALTLASDDAWDARAKLLKFLDSPKETLSDLVDWGASEPANAALLVDLLEQAVRDRMAAALGPQGVAARMFLESRAERLAEARRQLQAPLNRKLLLQDLLIPWIAR